MLTFIAGATSSGACVARPIVLTRSSASPWASLANRCAVAGATTSSSAQSAREMWSISPSSLRSKSCERAGAPVNVCNTSGVTKRSASGVSTQRTA